MGIEQLPIKLDPDVFKINDPRVQLVMSGRMSHQAFAVSLSEKDPFYILHDTVYALTAQEYYAMRSVAPVKVLTNDAFHQILDLPDKSYMHEADRLFLERVKAELPTCPACRYKQYKEEVLKLSKKYNLNVSPIDYTQSPVDEYPTVSGTITPVVSMLVDRLYSITLPPRRSCIDCVEKHMSQAWVLANESYMGYPEHIRNMTAHIAEAMDELPDQFYDLRITLEYCLARTNYTRTAFFPLPAMLPLLKTARGVLEQSHESQQDINVANRPTTMELNFTDSMKATMDNSQLSKHTAEKLHTLLSRIPKITLEYKNQESDQLRMEYEGILANAADLVAQQCPEFANMLRCRRLFFIANPALANEAGFACEDICEYLKAVYLLDLAKGS